MLEVSHNENAKFSVLLKSLLVIPLLNNRFKTTYIEVPKVPL